jgi:hypothetical protein
MTGAEFTARYRLREQLHDGPVSTFRAIDSRGSKVFVHVFRDPTVPAFDQAALDARGTALVREVLDVEGLGVVVTGEIEPFTTFDAWTASRQKDAGEEGAYTRIFRIPTEPVPAVESKVYPDPTPSIPPGTPDVTVHRTPAEPSAPAPAAAPAASLGTPLAPEEPYVPAAAVPETPRIPEVPPTPKPPAAPEPPVVPKAPVRSAPPEAPPGEYTMLFGASPASTPKAPAPPPPTPPRQPSVEDSTYSRIMRPASTPPLERQSPAQSPPTPPPPAYRPPEVDRRPAASTLPPEPPRAPAEAGPSDSSGAYTMIMRAGGAPPTAPTPTARPTPPARPAPPIQSAQPPRAPESLGADLYADNYSHRLRDPGPDVTPHNVPAAPDLPKLERSLYEPPAPYEPSSYTMIIGKGAAPYPAAGGFGAAPSYPPPPPPSLPPPAPPPPPAKAQSKTPLVVGLVLIAAILVGVIVVLVIRQG